MPLALVASFELLDVLRLVGIAERLYRPVNTVAESKSGEFARYVCMYRMCLATFISLLKYSQVQSRGSMHYRSDREIEDHIFL